MRMERPLVVLGWVLAWLVQGSLHAQPAQIESTRPDELIIHVTNGRSLPSMGADAAQFDRLAVAQQFVRRQIEGGLRQNIRVVIHGDAYLDAPLRFDMRDVPPAGLTITYAGVDAEHPGVISGGRILHNWQDEGSGKWSTALPLTASAAEGPAADVLPLRQLFFDEQRLYRARSPNVGYVRVVAAGPDQRTSLQVDPADWQSHPPEPSTELAYLHDWSMSRVRVAAFDPSGHWLTFADKVGGSYDFFRIGGFEAHPRYFLENSELWLDQAGEFHADRSTGRLTIMLSSGANPNETPLVMPRLPALVEIAGTAETPVRGICLEHLIFAHTTCPIPPGGYAGIQAGFFEDRRPKTSSEEPADPVTESGHASLPAALRIAFAEGVRIEGCEFRHLGGDAIRLDRETDRCEVLDSTIRDVGSCGIRIGETLTREQERPDGSDLTCAENRVHKCRIFGCGKILLGSVGIWIGIARDTVVSENEIHDLPYTGISVGWRWDREPSGCRGNQILGNHIHHVMQELSDGAGIYTLGRQPGTVLRGNRIHDVRHSAGRADSNGIFMDEGSSEMIVEENTIFGTDQSPIRFHRAGPNVIRKNVLHVANAVAPFTFNSTEQTELTFESNRVLP